MGRIAMSLAVGCTLVVIMAAALWPGAAAAQDSIDAQSQACLQCHGNEGFATEKAGQRFDLYVDSKSLGNSVHGQNGCLSCHPAEQTLPHQEPAFGGELAVKVSQNCQSCHTSEGREFEQSSHAAGANLTCISCHGSGHALREGQFAGIEGRQAVVDICINCHQGSVAAGYRESFHGKAVNLGSSQAATCTSCHGSHRILGPDDPGSPIAQANVASTCATCHDNPAPGFSRGQEHFELKPEGSGLPMYYTAKFFTWLTIVVMALLIIHIELELYRKLRSIPRG